MATLLTPHGAVVMREQTIAQGDAELLRRYKKFLLKYGMKEALWCVRCAADGRPDGLRASVMDDKIEMACRCTVRRYRGQTY
jgi:hypothetical protein